jgi:hypothetical protein
VVRDLLTGQIDCKVQVGMSREADLGRGKGVSTLPVLRFWSQGPNPKGAIEDLSLPFRAHASAVKSSCTASVFQAASVSLASLDH